MEQRIICNAKFVARTGCRDALYMALNSLVEPTLKEEGCLSYELLASVENPNRFVTVEEFTNKKSLEFHSNQPYLETFKNNLDEIVEHVVVHVARVER